MAQAFHHSILPLASHADQRTEILWGLRDFAWRFGRPATAMWLPETAVDLATLRVAAEAGVKAVILAPWQADSAHVDTRQPYRVDVGGGRHITAMFYDGELSAAVSFEPASTADADRFARERVAPRLDGALGDGGDPTLVIATDGELYGHHQSFRDLFLQRLVAPEAGSGRSFDVVGFQAATAEARGPPAPRDPDPRPDLVELPSRRAALDRRVPGRPGRPLEGPAAGGARTARRRHRQRRPTRSPATSAASTTRGRPATATSTSSSGRSRATRSPRPASGGARPPRSGPGCSRSWRRSAGGWACSPRAAGSGRTRSGPRRTRCCAPPRGPCGSSTASRDPASSSACSPTSARCGRPSTGIDGEAIYRKALIEVGQPPPVES